MRHFFIIFCKAGNFVFMKPAQASGHGSSEQQRARERAEEQASPPRWGGRSGLKENKISCEPKQNPILII